MFEVGYHAESVAGIADLVEHCPVGSKSACSTAQAGVSRRTAARISYHGCIQAEMYVRLATLATKNEGYDRAVQLLSRAQSLGPFHAIPELEFISLVGASIVRCSFCADDLRYAAGGLVICSLALTGKNAKYCISLNVSVRRWSRSGK